jgi:putative nucleotidyltransferase with HDIG domain
MVRYRKKGEKLSAADFNKLLYSHVKVVFVDEHDRTAFKEWVAQNAAADVEKSAGLPAPGKDAAKIVLATTEQRRAAMDLFSSPSDDQQVIAAVEASKKVVGSFLSSPYAVNHILTLQHYSKGVADHSMNVSVLSVFLGMRMGYSHQPTLENLALGGLFHDVGKVAAEAKPDIMNVHGDDEAAVQRHPMLGTKYLDKFREIPNEVRMIVGQHHEYLNGTGYHLGLKGMAIYDLARVVTIANVYDNLISNSLAPMLKERARDAVERLESLYRNKLDPKKLEKAVKILRYSFL